MSEPNQVGRCACGQVEVELQPGTRWCANGYAERDRREFAAPYVTWLGVRFDRFALTGSEHLRWWRAPDGRERGFCGTCGTSVLVRSEHWPGQVQVPAAALDGGPWRRPSANLQADERPDWVVFDASLPGFGGDSGGDTVGEGAWQDRLGDASAGIRVASPFDALELSERLGIERSTLESRLGRRQNGVVLLLEREHRIAAVLEAHLLDGLDGDVSVAFGFHAGDAEDIDRLARHLAE